VKIALVHYYLEEYPENCHYAVINGRDYSFLHRAGLERTRLFSVFDALLTSP
jgi:hypothetical protein